MILQQYKVELRRLLHRRALEVLAVLAVCALAVLGVSMFLATGAEQLPVNVEVSGAGFEDGDAGFTYAERTFCPSTLVTSGAAQDSVALGGGTECPRSTPNPIPREVTYLGSPAPYSPWNGSIGYFSVASLLVLWVLAASLVGEEFRHGTVETALVAEPRRLRLLSIRLAALLSVGIGVYVIASLGFLVAVAPAWKVHGIEGTSVAATLLLAAFGRGLLAVTLVVLLSGALAVIGRGAMLSLGVLVGLSVVTAALFLFLRTLLPIEFFTSVWAVVTGGDSMAAYRVSPPGYEPITVTQFGAGWPWASAVLVVCCYVVVALAAAFALFARRDIR